MSTEAEESTECNLTELVLVFVLALPLVLVLVLVLVLEPGARRAASGSTTRCSLAAGVSRAFAKALSGPLSPTSITAPRGRLPWACQGQSIPQTKQKTNQKNRYKKTELSTICVNERRERKKERKKERRKKERAKESCVCVCVYEVVRAV